MDSELKILPEGLANWDRSKKDIYTIMAHTGEWAVTEHGMESLTTLHIVEKERLFHSELLLDAAENSWPDLPGLIRTLHKAKRIHWRYENVK